MIETCGECNGIFFKYHTNNRIGYAIPVSYTHLSKTQPETEMQKTVFALFQKNLGYDDFGKMCIRDRDCVEMTYRELRENAEKAAANLQAMGIGCGDSVCVSVCNRASFLTAFWGVVLSGAEAIPIERTAFGRPKEEAARSRIASIQRIAQPKVCLLYTSRCV